MFRINKASVAGDFHVRLVQGPTPFRHLLAAADKRIVEAGVPPQFVRMRIQETGQSGISAQVDFRADVHILG